MKVLDDDPFRQIIFQHQNDILGMRFQRDAVCIEQMNNRQRYRSNERFTPLLNAMMLNCTLDKRYPVRLYQHKCI
ncbi:hypothetical protein D1872_291140 [compost metagenome]